MLRTTALKTSQVCWLSLSAAASSQQFHFSENISAFSQQQRCLARLGDARKDAFTSSLAIFPNLPLTTGTRVLCSHENLISHVLARACVEKTKELLCLSLHPQPELYPLPLPKQIPFLWGVIFFWGVF